jgi:hypothetical protein
MTYRDFVTLNDGSQVDANLLPHDLVCWRAKARADLYYEGRHWKNPDGTTNRPDYTVESTGNLLLRGGGSLMWEYAKGSGSTASTAAKKYVNATAALAIGNSTVAAAATQTALQGGSQLYKALTGGFPTHTTGSTAATVVDIVFKTTYGTTQGNFAWNEFGLANKATTTQRRLLTRKVQALLTKTTAATATLTVTISLA